MKRVWSLIFFLLLPHFSWGSCYDSPGSPVATSRSSCYYGENCGESKTCDETAVQCQYFQCDSRMLGTGSLSGRYFFGCSRNIGKECDNSSSKSCVLTNGSFSRCDCIGWCQTENEADSVQCEMDGGEWNGSECGFSSSSSTESSSSSWEDVDACEDDDVYNDCKNVGGTWEQGYTEDGVCRGNCNWCDTELWKQYEKAAKSNCCDIGTAPQSGSLCQNIVPPFTGTNESYMMQACQVGVPSNFSNWCRDSSGTDTTETDDEPNCFGSNCPSSSSDEEISSSSAEPGSSSSYDREECEAGGGIWDDETESCIFDSSGEGSSSSEGGGGDGGGDKDTTSAGGDGDFEYNYHPKLDTIIKWLKRQYALLDDVGESVTTSLDANTAKVLERLTTWRPEMLDSLLSAVKQVGKGDTTLVNVESSDTLLYDRIDSVMSLIEHLDSLGRQNDGKFQDSLLGVLNTIGFGSGGDSLGGYWDGDSAIGALIDSLSGLFDTTGWKEWFDTTGMGNGNCIGGENDCGLDSILSEGVDSVLAGFTDSRNDSLAGVIGGQIKGLIDSGAVGAFTDSLDKMVEMFNFNRFSGNGGCPPFLTESAEINLGGVSVELDGVGNLLCTTKVSIFGKTPWEIGRALIRAILAITCMFWLFRVATGAQGGDDD